MKTQNTPKYLTKFLQPTRVFIVLMLAVAIYLLPFGSKPEFINHDGQIVEIPRSSPILQSFYPQGIYASCGDGGTGTNCHTGCCSAGACVVCPPPPDDRPPSISANLNCSTPGNGGWCIGALFLDLSASDPQGAAVLISGTLNGVPFACQSGATSCSIPISQEGIGSTTYRVDAATGLSDSGSIGYQLDLSTPDLIGSANGVIGLNNWFRSNTTLIISSSDLVSGLASITTSVDGGAATPYSSPITFADGIHVVLITATDNAGNIKQDTQTIQVDTITPLLTTSINGTSGLNDWYVSTFTVTPSVKNEGSSTATLEASIDGNAYIPYVNPITFTDGIHTYQFRAADNAGNVSETLLKTVKVDTTTPTISLSFGGRQGNDEWYITTATVTPISNDATAGIASIEAITDGGAWSIINTPLSFSDGLHSYQFRVTDNAGNSTAIPIQNIKVDTIPPAIDMTEELSLGERVYYELQDAGSGLAIYRAVIEDDDEKYKKIVWLEDIGGNKLADQILWDGKFADGTQAGWGEYFITLKISDAAGNERMESAVVTVNPFSFLQEIPAFTPPLTTTQSAATSQTDSTPLTQFGGENNNNQNTGEAVVTNEGGESIVWPEGSMGAAPFSISSTTTSTSLPLDPNILWGAAATALVGATLADWQRQREEEERRRAEEQAREDRHNITQRRQAQQAAETAVRERWEVEAAAREMQQSRTADSLRWAGAASIAQAQQTAQQAQEQTNFDHRMDEHTGEQDVVDNWYAQQVASGGSKPLAIPVQDDPPKWWEKPLAWIDGHQVEISIGVGVVVGAAAIILSGGVATPLVAAAWMAGAAAVAGGTIALGTVGLNSYYDRPLGTNIIQNLVVAGVTAAVVTGVGLLVAPWASTTIGAVCTNYATACSQVGTIIDKGEEALLSAQLAYYNWTDDQDNAALAAMELQLELIDGDAPGNTITAEVSEQLAQLGPDAVELIGQHGDEIIPLLLKYGDDAVDIIGAYGDDGISLLTLHGKDAVKLIKEYGTPGVKILGAVNFEDANKLLSNLDPKTINDLVELDAKAITALSKLPADVLLESGADAVYIAGVYGDEGLSLLTLFGNDAASLINEYGTPAVGLLTTHGDEVIDIYQNGHLAETSLAEIIPAAHYDEVVKAFKADTSSAVTLDKDLTVYRYWSGDVSNEVGRWTSVNPLMTSDEARALLALPKSNLATNVTEFTIPKGTTIVLGEASSQTASGWAGSYATGGALQIYIADPGVLIKTP